MYTKEHHPAGLFLKFTQNKEKKKKKGALNKTVEDVITNMSYTVNKFMEILVGHNLLQSFGGMKWYIVL